MSGLDYTGQVALITGGTAGLGRGIAETFLAAGANVVVCGRKTPDTLPAAGGRTASFVACDVRDPESVDKLVAAVVAQHGRLDVLVNNAGGAPFTEAATASPRFSEKIIALNLTRSLAVEWAPRVRVNAITAGMIRTEQAHLHYGDEAGIARVSATVPLGRLALPEDIANACLFLASPLASYVSGADLLIHGGGERPAFLDAATANKAEH